MLFVGTNTITLEEFQVLREHLRAASSAVLAHAANLDPVLQKMQMDKPAGGRPSRASPQISDQRDDRDRHGGPKGSAESRVHRDPQITRDKQESSSLKEEMKRERMLITVSHEPVAKSKPAADQVKDKTVAVSSKGSRKDEDEDDVEEKSSTEHGKKSEAKRSKSLKKVLAKKKMHKAKKKKSKKKKDKRKS